MAHDIKKLPLWAQKLLKDKDFEISQLQALEQAHAVLNNRKWCSVSGPLMGSNETCTLWVLDKDSPVSVCSLGQGDVLLIGRQKPTKQKEI